MDAHYSLADDVPAPRADKHDSLLRLMSLRKCLENARASIAQHEARAQQLAQECLRAEREVAKWMRANKTNVEALVLKGAHGCESNTVIVFKLVGKLGVTIEVRDISKKTKRRA